MGGLAALRGSASMDNLTSKKWSRVEVKLLDVLFQEFSLSRGTLE
jgi:hypothetical protein